MKDMAIENAGALNMEKTKQDRLEQVLADGELILNRVNARLDRIDKRQLEIEKTIKAIEGAIYLEEWKLKKGVK